MTGREPVHVVGLLGGAPVGFAAQSALAKAALVIGSADQVAAAADAYPTGARVLALGAGLDALDALTDPDAGGDGGTTCVLASGDPGFFGIVRALGARIGPERLVVHPAPSSVALAFAAAGLAWDDAAVVSVHGRSLDELVPAVRERARVAVLVSPEHPPEAVGATLRAAGVGRRTVVVASHLGERGESVTRTDLDGLADGRFPSRSVVLVLDEQTPAGPSPSWARPVDAFAHRASMITKPEVRAVVLGRLELPARGVLWDLGAGSGSVGIEAALSAPGLRVIAVERRPDDAARIRANASELGALVEVIEGDATDADLLDALPRPDRVFVGGGGPAALALAHARLRPRGRIVATFAAIDRAADAHRRLGHLVQVGIDRAATLPDGGVRFAADNPVFVAWGDAGATDEADCTADDRGDRLVVGVGCSSTASAADAEAALAATLTSIGAGRDDVVGVATIDRRRDHPAVTGLGVPVRTFTSDELAAVPVPHPSPVVAGAVGTPSVAEAAALLAAGAGARLLVPKSATERVTIAIAQTGTPAVGDDGDRVAGARRGGSLSVVGLGPGDARHRTPAAVEAVRRADVVVGFGPYVDQCADLLRPDQRVVRSGMGDEAARADAAISAALAGSRVALVSSGDPGVFAMASVTLELASERAPELAVTVVPGVTAAQTAAALVGAPLAHDHAAISLSDRITPWPTIEARVVAAASSDLVVALYNPRSRQRTGHLPRALELLAAHRPAATPVALVTNASRPGQAVVVTTLGALVAPADGTVAPTGATALDAVDMNTIVIVGSTDTAVLGDRVVTRRHHPRPAGTMPRGTDA